MPRDQFVSVRPGSSLPATLGAGAAAIGTVALNAAIPAGANTIGNVNVNGTPTVRPQPAAATVTGSGSVVAPAAAATVVATIPAGSLPAGAYEVHVNDAVSGTPDGPLMLELRRGTTLVGALVTTTTPGSNLPFLRVDLSGTEALTVQTTAAGAATYTAVIRATRLV